MTVPEYARMTYREIRGAGGRLVYFTACLAIGVAAVVAVASLAQSFRDGFQEGAKELLGADISVSARQPFPTDIAETIDGAIPEISGTRQITFTRDQPSIISNPATGATVLSEIKVVDGDYPLYGDLGLEPNRPFTELLNDDSAIVEPKLLTQLNLQLGDAVRVGGRDFTIVAIARTDPDRITGFMYIGPRVFLTPGGFGETEVANFDAVARNKALIKLPAANHSTIDAVAVALRESFGEGSEMRVEHYIEGRPSLERGLDRLESFLGLVALLSLLLGGVGVSQAIRTWINGRMTAIAIFKCIGFRPRELFALYLIQSLALGLFGSLVGAGLALLMLTTLPPLLEEYIPRNFIDPFQPGAIVRGFVLGLAVTTAFSLPPLLTVLRVSPARVFRREAEPLPAPRAIRILAVVAALSAVIGAAALQAKSTAIGVSFVLAVIGGTLVLALAARVVVLGIGRLPRNLGSFAARHGLASLTRPGAPAVPSIVAIGLGLVVLFATLTLQIHINRQLKAELPEDVPSFLIADLRSNQVDEMQRILDSYKAEDIRIDPMLRSSITAVNGIPAAEVIENSENPGRIRRRLQEQFVTFSREMPSGNTLVEGELWSDPDVLEASLDTGLARRLDLGIGDTLTFDFEGTDQTLTITSLRENDFEEGFEISFDVMAEPESANPDQTKHVVTARLPTDREQMAQDQLAAAFPNVVMLRISPILNRVRDQLNRIGWGIRFLSLFIIGAGLAVLAGAVGMESMRRGREVALLKTLGMTRGQIAVAFAAEYAIIGIVAAGIGVFTGSLLAYFAITRGFELDFYLPVLYPTGAIAITVLLCVTVGIAASVRALSRSPIDTFRSE